MICTNLTNNSLSSEILDFVKQHLRIIGSDEDIYLTALINGIIDNLTNTICYSPIANDYLCSFDIDLKNTTLIEYDCDHCWLKLQVIYPFNELLEITIDGEIVEVDTEICDYFIRVDIKDFTCKNYFCIKLKYNAGVTDPANIPGDFLLLIALETQKVYDCDCDCSKDLTNNISNKYNKKRFI